MFIACKSWVTGSAIRSNGSGLWSSFSLSTRPSFWRASSTWLMYVWALLSSLGQIWVTDRESIDPHKYRGNRCHAPRTDSPYHFNSQGQKGWLDENRGILEEIFNASWRGLIRWANRGVLETSAASEVDPDPANHGELKGLLQRVNSAPDIPLLHVSDYDVLRKANHWPRRSEYNDNQRDTKLLLSLCWHAAHWLPWLR
jgi:hypothetical protein